MPRSVFCAAASVDVDGWSVAAFYDDPAREYAALRDGAALVDLAYRARLRVTGGDRVEFLQGMLSNDVKRLAPGGGCRALLLTEQGKVVADTIVLALPDAILLDARASAAARAAEALTRYVVADDVELEIETGTHAVGVFGPNATAALATSGITAPPQAPCAHVAVAVDDATMRVVRVPDPGAGGYLCIGDESVIESWWRQALERGVSVAGFTAFEALRIESGVPADGVDVGPDTIALEAPLDDRISFDKGCYLGQEVVERVSARGHVNRKLVRLTIDAATAPSAGDAIVADEKEIGRVTSAAWSWRLAQPVALGYVRREHVAPGTCVGIRGATGTFPAVVEPSPDGSA